MLKYKSDKHKFRIELENGKFYFIHSGIALFHQEQIDIAGVQRFKNSINIAINLHNETSRLSKTNNSTKKAEILEEYSDPELIVCGWDEEYPGNFVKDMKELRNE